MNTQKEAVVAEGKAPRVSVEEIKSITVGEGAVQIMWPETAAHSSDGLATMLPKGEAIELLGKLAKLVVKPITGGSGTVSGTIAESLDGMLPKLGTEFTRFSYDMAVRIESALDCAGYKIVRKPVRK